MRIAQHETAIDAFHAHVGAGKAEAQRERIRNFIASNKKYADWSIGEIAHALDMEKSTVSARLNEMLNETKQLVAKAKRHDRISNILIRPVALPEIQRDFFNS